MTVNRILTDKDRQAYAFEIDLMNKHAPDMMARKIQDAVVQQAFVLHTVIYDFAHPFYQRTKQLPTVLSAGSWEDTAGETLKKLGYKVWDCDPVVNSDLHTFRLQGHGEFDVVISTSVLEHTENDEEFVADSACLLLPGGMGIFTVDYLNEWDGGGTPATSRRFYTAHDLEHRLRAILRDNDCDLIDDPDYYAKDRFSWEGYNYSFATFVFTKNK